MKESDIAMRGAGEFGDVIKEGAWRGFPVRFRDMLMSLHSDDGPQGEPAEAIEYLTRALQAAEGKGWEVALNRLNWVGEFFANCFDPVYHEGAWHRSAESAIRLVRDAEAVLMEFHPEVEAPLARDELPETGALDIRCLRQDLHAYGCVASGFAGDESEFRRRLDAVVKSNELNVRLEAEQSRAILSLPYEEVGPDMRYAECFTGSRLWTDILAYVANAAPYMGWEVEVAESYRRYISYLVGAVQWGAPFMSSVVEAKAELGKLEGETEPESGSNRSPF